MVRREGKEDCSSLKSAPGIHMEIPWVPRASKGAALPMNTREKRTLAHFLLHGRKLVRRKNDTRQNC